MCEPFLERQRRRAAAASLVVVGEEQAVRRVADGARGARAARRTRSCRRRPRARRRSSRACCRARSGRRPCARPVAARSPLASRDTSTSSRLSSPCPRARMRVAAARARPAARGRRRAWRAVPGPPFAEASIRGRAAADDCERLLVGDLTRAAATGRRPPPSTPRPSRGCRCPPTVVLVEERIADRPRRVVLAQPPQEAPLVEARARGCRGRARRGAGRSGCVPSVISSSTGPSNCTTSWRRRAGYEPRAPRRAAPAAPLLVRSPQAPVIRRWLWSVRSPSKRMNRCLPWVSTARTSRPASRSGQRSAAWRRCGVTISSGTRPTRTGRMRFAA